MKKKAETIRRVGLYGNSQKPAFRRLTHRALGWLRRAGCTVLADAPTAQRAGLPCPTAPDAAALAREVDCILVFGGDGTMLRAAREIRGAATPLLGVNLGGLGFLTAVPAAGLIAALQQIRRGEFALEPRALIQAICVAEEREIRQSALNDIVISRGSTVHLIELEVRVENDLLTRYRCDGLIVSTPTGSTAYSLAAGGAIVFPGADVMAITPICPHTLSNRSVIVSLDASLRIRVITADPGISLSADGQILCPLTAGGEVTVRRSPHRVQLMRLPGSSFFDTLRHKLHWRGAHV